MVPRPLDALDRAYLSPTGRFKTQSGIKYNTHFLIMQTTDESGERSFVSGSMELSVEFVRYFKITGLLSPVAQDCDTFVF